MLSINKLHEAQRSIRCFSTFLFCHRPRAASAVRQTFFLRAPAAQAPLIAHWVEQLLVVYTSQSYMTEKFCCSALFTIRHLSVVLRAFSIRRELDTQLGTVSYTLPLCTTGIMKSHNVHPSRCHDSHHPGYLKRAGKHNLKHDLAEQREGDLAPSELMAHNHSYGLPEDM